MIAIGAMFLVSGATLAATPTIENATSTELATVLATEMAPPPESSPRGMKIEELAPGATASVEIEQGSVRDLFGPWTSPVAMNLWVSDHGPLPPALLIAHGDRLLILNGEHAVTRAQVTGSTPEALMNALAGLSGAGMEITFEPAERIVLGEGGIMSVPTTPAAVEMAAEPAVGVAPPESSPRAMNIEELAPGATARIEIDEGSVRDLFGPLLSPVATKLWVSDHGPLPPALLIAHGDRLLILNGEHAVTRSQVTGSTPEALMNALADLSGAGKQLTLDSAERIIIGEGGIKAVPASPAGSKQAVEGAIESAPAGELFPDRSD